MYILQLGMYSFRQAQLQLGWPSEYLLIQEQEMESFKSDAIKEARMEAELKEFQKENAEQRQHIMALQGEVYGARLAAKYLDKELAGRWVVGVVLDIEFSHFEAALALDV